MAKIAQRIRFKISVNIIESDKCVFSVVNNKTQILLRYLPIENKLVDPVYLAVQVPEPKQ